FAETKELVAGYWILQVKSKEEAIEWIKRCPNPHEGESEIEIRQVFELEDFGASEPVEHHRRLGEQIGKKRLARASAPSVYRGGGRSPRRRELEDRAGTAPRCSRAHRAWDALVAALELWSKSKYPGEGATPDRAPSNHINSGPLWMPLRTRVFTCCGPSNRVCVF